MSGAANNDDGPGLFGHDVTVGGKTLAARVGSDASGREDRDVLLIERYKVVGRTLDDLPYTDEFEELYKGAGGDAVWGSRREAFRRLHNLRKASKLPTMGRGLGVAGGAARVKLTDEEEAGLAAMVVERVGTLGQRDQLVYDRRLDEIAEQFNGRWGRGLRPYDVWRLVAKLAK